MGPMPGVPDYMTGAPIYYPPPSGFRPVFPPGGMVPGPRWAPQPRPGQPMPGYGGHRNNYPMQQRPPRGPPPMSDAGDAPHTQPTGQQHKLEQDNQPTETDKDTLTASSLASASPEMQKQMLGEKLYPLIHSQQPEYSGKITGMLLEMDNRELLNLLEDRASLDRKVNEAMNVLKAHLADESK